MITGSQIHKYLQQPNKIRAITLESLVQLQENYPYFPIAAMMLQYFKNGNSRDISLHEYYNYNPIVFYYWKEDENWPSTEQALKEKKPLNLHPENWDAATESLLEHEQNHSQKDYFSDVSFNLDYGEKDSTETTEDQSLLVVMSFSEWLNFLQKKSQKEREEEEEKRALKNLWQKQKMAEAIEEENNEIPPEVFEMAVNSISREDSIISESMAIVYEKQGKVKEAIDIYKKLILNNPNKSTYFADKIENLQKEIE
ncbi:MAG TPA: hypothetical protein VLZ83_14825 [Edaphocola sp.]|nr:hypothetical protein [Edaphocola sp.]